MTNADNLLQSMSQISSTKKSLPPVEQWDPDYCGEMDLVLKANGEWRHNNQPMTRKKIIRLFSTILKKENDRYYLVSPVEKIGIQVEWQPFVIIDFEISSINNQAGFIFIDNCNNKIPLNVVGQMQMDRYCGNQLPIVKVRNNLYASFNRSCYYRLIEQSKVIKSIGHQEIKLESFGLEFTLGKIDNDEVNSH